MCRLIFVLVVCIGHKQVFSWLGSNDVAHISYRKLELPLVYWRVPRWEETSRYGLRKGNNSWGNYSYYISTVYYTSTVYTYMKRIIVFTWEQLTRKTITFGSRQANLVLIAYASSDGSGEPAHPRSLAKTSAAHSYKQGVKRNLQTESQIPGTSEWLGMRS